MPPLGYKVFQLESSSENGQRELTEPSPKDGVLENECLRVTAENDGTLSLLDKRSGTTYKDLNCFLDEGDAGDEYNFSPPTQQIETSSLEADWTVESNVAPNTFTMKGDLNLPRSLVETRSYRSEEKVWCPAIVEVRLLPGSRRVDITTEFYNRARDHRLRAIFSKRDGSRKIRGRNRFWYDRAFHKHPKAVQVGGRKIPPPTPSVALST